MSKDILRLAVRRKQLGLTQTELGDQLGVSCGAIGNWEAGIRKPSIIMLKRIAGIFGCTTDALLSDVNTKMTRIEKLRTMSLEDMADKISDYGLVDGYCKSDCAEDNDCLHEHECVVRWLSEEVTE